MQKVTQGWGIAFLGLFAACSSAPSVQTSAQGIVSVAVERTRNGVTLRAVDSQGVSVGTLRYARGPVVVEELGPDAVDGVSLVVEVGELQMAHTSAGHAALALPIEDVREDEAKVAEFLRDSRVAAEMARVDVTFVVRGAQSLPIADGETALAACTYGANSSCGTGDCFQFTGSPVYQNRCCPSSKNAVRRQCTGNPGGTNSCGSVGGLGCSVCWSVQYSDKLFGTCWIDPANGDMFWRGNLATNCVPTGYQFCTSNSQCCGQNCNLATQTCSGAQ